MEMKVKLESLEGELANLSGEGETQKNLTSEELEGGSQHCPSGETEKYSILRWALGECLLSGRNHVQMEFSPRH